ncbi:RNA polymerase sigma factor [Streptomyces xanthophaeus]|uniref:RNA polymerase sigma factor n=1 Tax=Streptomyces xanthophaeus TaxID=67385 RepID=UPI003646845C
MVESETTSANAVALDAVFRAFRSEMTAVASRMLRSRSIPEAAVGAEDIVQSAFTRALRAPEELRAPRAYVYTALRREVAYQGERMHQWRRKETAYLADERVAVRDSQDVAALVAERMVLWEALHRLPQGQRMALVWTKLYGYTQSEMAYIAGRHPGTIAAAVSNAVAHLRGISLGQPVGGLIGPAMARAWLNDPWLVLWSAAKRGASRSDGDLRVQFIALQLELEMARESKQWRIVIDMMGVNHAQLRGPKQSVGRGGG